MPWGIMKKLLLVALFLFGGLSAVHAQTSASWTIMHYTNVDNNLESAAFNDYYEMQSAGSGNGINIVAQLDRAVGFDTRFGDWTDTRRFVIQHVDPLPDPTIEEQRRAVIAFFAKAKNVDEATVAAQAEQVSDAVIQRFYTENNVGVTFEQTPAEDLGEVDMGDPQSLVDFIEWSVQNYPAEHYMLIIGSHGGGWRGIGPDDGSDPPSMLTLPEIDSALTTARQDLGLDKLDIIGFDACLMAVTDVAVTLEPHADYVLFSQEVIPSNGWDYYNSLTTLKEHPDMDAYDLGTVFIDSYMDYYAGKGSRSKVGLSLVDTAALPDLLSTLDAFAVSIEADTGDLLSALGTARNNSQIFGASLGDRASVYSYIDLRDFMNWFGLQSSITEDAYNAAQAVIAAYDMAVVYSRADDKLPRAHGLGVYLPATQAEADSTYVEAAPSAMNFWVDYLSNFYRTITADLDGSKLQIDIKKVFTLGETGSSIDTPVVFFDAAGQGVVDLSYTILYVSDDGTRTVVDAAPISYNTTLPTGETLIEYPNEPTPSTFAWSVEFPFLSDGSNNVLSLATSSSGAGSEMSIGGTYVTAQGSQQASLVFDSGTYAYLGMLASDGTTVYQANPTPGDQFIVDLVTITPDGQVAVIPQSDIPLTFGVEPFTFSYRPAVSGNYQIGLTITDLAGNAVRKLVNLTVNNDDVTSTVRGYTDTNEGIYFQYPYAWGESYSLTQEDGSLTNVVSDNEGTQFVYVDTYYDTDPATALDQVLSGIDGEISAVQEMTFAGMPAYAATYTVTGDEGASTSVVYSVANEPADSVVMFTFTGVGGSGEPDSSVVQLFDSTVQFFPPQE